MRVMPAPSTEAREQASMALLREQANSALPKGAIIMWAGALADIPSGFALCDGNNGTPNLVNTFVKGIATSTTEPGGTGGAATHNHNAHSNHTFTPPDTHSLTSNTPVGVSIVQSGAGITVASQTHTHTDTATHTGGGVNAHSSHSTENHEPVYFALAFIMRIG